jgi:Na+-driven multidrug efflux pump
VFQALGKTLPSLASSFTRTLITAIPVLLLAQVPGFALWWVWTLSATTVYLQLALSLLLLRREFHRRLVLADAAMPMRAPV